MVSDPPLPRAEGKKGAIAFSLMTQATEVSLEPADGRVPSCCLRVKITLLNWEFNGLLLGRV